MSTWTHLRTLYKVHYMAEGRWYTSAATLTSEVAADEWARDMLDSDCAYTVVQLQESKRDGIIDLREEKSG
jgi:hypothetical protein